MIARFLRAKPKFYGSSLGKCQQPWFSCLRHRCLKELSYDLEGGHCTHCQAGICIGICMQQQVQTRLSSKKSNPTQYGTCLEESSLPVSLIASSVWLSEAAAI